MHTSTLPELLVVQSRISPESWETRVRSARDDGEVMQRIADCVARGELLNHAIRKIVPVSRRSWVIRNYKRYQRYGFEGLIDRRVPREPKVAKASGPLIEEARKKNPRVTYAEVVQLLREQKVTALPSRSTVKVHFARVDDRRRYARKNGKDEIQEETSVEISELPLAGGELMLAAELETGAISALTDEVVSIGEEAKAASKGRTPLPDVAHRSEQGHFTVTYFPRNR